MRVTWTKLKSALRAANPKLVLLSPLDTKEPNPYRAMIYIRRPGSVDCVDGTILEEVLAIASPVFFQWGCPLEGVALTHADHPSIPVGKKQWVRGANSAFRIMASMRVDGRALIDVKAARRALPEAFRKLDMKKQKAEIQAHNAEPISDIRKKAKWLKGRAKPIPGNGMPLDWKPTKIISDGVGSSHTPAGLL